MNSSQVSVHNRLPISQIEIKGLIGVGDLSLSLEPEQQVYTFIGQNGVGKTKMLEALFQYFFINNQLVTINSNYRNHLERKYLVFEKIVLNSRPWQSKSDYLFFNNLDRIQNGHQNNLPIVYIASQARGFIKPTDTAVEPLGNINQRQDSYFLSIIESMSNNFTNMNMDVDIENWFVKIAHSANPYQQKEDNREIEIKTLLMLINQIDPRIDPDFMEISGANHVSIKIEGEVRELSQLSTGFASILKIMQSVISGYGYYTNQSDLQNVNGLVMIDEIESHLHLNWQTKIIPLLKKLFPNTTFFITTHSPLVLSLLSPSEAYRLNKLSINDKKRVTSVKLSSPQNSALIDLLNEAFDLDLNREKLTKLHSIDQTTARRSLLTLLDEQGE